MVPDTIFENNKAFVHVVLTDEELRQLVPNPHYIHAGNKWIDPEKTYEDFCKSAYYNAFVKFGSFINNVNPLYPDKFIDFVIKSGVKLDHWCRDELYETYLYEMLKAEPVEAAIQRSIKTMMDWADANGAHYTSYFAFASISRIIQHIRDGKISPWLLLNCANAIFPFLIKISVTFGGM